jgi:ubiquinone/menaquinone biosynthesis C-methylase UbiE
MFKNSANIYDAIYSFKDYGRECQTLERHIAQHKRSQGKALLDVACGTGHHIGFLKLKYEVEGLDLEPQLLDVARQRNPGVQFHQGDMTDFQLPSAFDVITCLFSAIGYVQTESRLKQALKSMRDHLEPGGVILVEPWFSPETYKEGTVHAVFVDRPDLKVARMNVSTVKDRLSIIDFHYLVGTISGIERYEEHHELGLFTQQEFTSAMQECGLKVTHDAEGLTGRGLYIGVPE